MSNDTDAVYQIYTFAAQQRIRLLTQMIVDKMGRTVQSGPFKGMELLDITSWGGFTEASKLLGCYEAELHSRLEFGIQRKPEIVVNIGCAEGYYAVGLARRLPGVPVFAFDLEPQSQEICRLSAERNGVGGQLTVGGRCTADSLAPLVAGKRALIVMDCEGAEIELLTAVSVASMGDCDLIVECHDFMNRAITPTIAPLFVNSHAIEYIQEGPRDPSSFDCLARVHSLDRWLLVCEFRPELMFWLHCWSKTRA